MTAYLAENNNNNIEETSIFMETDSRYNYTISKSAVE
jgi:hypothetical protein